MRIVHVSHRDGRGGAAIAAYSLHRSLRAAGLDSVMVVATKLGDDSSVLQASRGVGRLLWLARKKVSRFLELFQRDPACHFYSLNLYSSGIVDTINGLKPDLVHLHWVGGETLSIESVPKIEAPIVWTMHDMWPFCGAEHLNLDPENERWVQGYTDKNRSTFASGYDWNRRVWERKLRSWKGLSMGAICPSRWSMECVERSRLFSEKAFGAASVIPNSVDLDVFVDVGEAKQTKLKYGLSDDRYLLAFGASQIDVPSKGWERLRRCLTKLAPRLDFEFVVFGRGRLPEQGAFRVVNIGELQDVSELARLYACCDLTLVPSSIESFGLVAAESMACGTPVVCFDISGLKDVVAHKETGYRAKAFSESDFVEGVLWCVSERDRYMELRRKSRKKVEEFFDRESVAAQHIQLYRSFLETGRIEEVPTGSL